MDEAKEKALLGWLGCLLDAEEQAEDGPASSMDLDYGTCFINILMYMDSSTSLDDYSSTKERVLATKKFLEDFYNTSFLDGSLVDFSIIISDEAPDAKRKEEIAKVLLLLLCAGIQDKNSDILTAAMKVDTSLHWDVRQLIEAVVRPDEPTTCLPADFAKVLLERSDPGPNDSAGFFCRLVNDNTSSSGAVSALSSARSAALSLSEMRDSPLRLRIASLNLSSMNDSGQITSPQRAGDDFPSTPLEQLVNSPQLARKIMQRDKEYRFKLELKEKEESLKKCQQELRTGVHLRDDLELDLQESKDQLHRKDSRIHELEEQVQRLRAVQDRLNELGTVQDSNLELERDVESLRNVAQTAETMKQCCHSLKEENSGLYEELSTLRDKVTSLEASEQETSKLQQQSDRLRGRVAELEGEAERWREAWDKAQEERRALEQDMGMLRKVNQEQRQQLLNRSGSDGDFNGSSSGESMGIVADKLVEELRAELDLMRSTWLSPDLHLAVKQDLEISQTAVAQLKAECGTLSEKVEELGKELQEVQTQLTDKVDRCQQLQKDVDQGEEERASLQRTVDDLQTQQASWFTQCDDLHSQLDSKREECQGLLFSLQHSSQHCDQLQTTVDDLQLECGRLTSDLTDTKQVLHTTQVEMKEKSQQCDQLASDLQSKNSELAQLVSEKSQAAAENESSRESLEKAVSLHKELLQSMTERDSEHQKALEQKETECKTLKSDLEDRIINTEHLEKLLERKEMECAGFQNDLSSKDSTLESLNKDLEEVQTVLKETRLAVGIWENQNLQQTVAEKSLEITQLNQRCEELESCLQEQKEKASSALMDLTHHQQLHQQAEEELDRLKSTLQSQLKDQLRAATQETEQQVQALTSQLQEKDTDLTQLRSDLASKDEALQNAQELEQQLQNQIDQLSSSNQSLEKQVSDKQAELEELEKLSRTMKDDLARVSNDLREARVLTDKAQADHSQVQTELTSLEEATAAQLKMAQEKWDHEMGSLKATHQDIQGQLEVKIRELEADLRQKTAHIEKLSEELESSHEKLEYIQHNHLATQEELQRNLNTKTVELDQEREKHQLSQQQFQQLETKFSSMQQTLKCVQGDLVDKEKVLLDNLESFQTSAAAKEMELNGIISSHQQQITKLEQQIEEQDSVIKQKEKVLVEMEHQHKAEFEALQRSAVSTEEELQHKISSQTQEVSELIQKLEDHESVIKEKEEVVEELKHQHAQELQELQQRCMQKEQELEAKESPVKENKLHATVYTLIGAIETRSVGEVISGLTGSESAPDPSILQLAESLDALLQQTETSECAAKQKEQELQIRLRESENQTFNLQTTITRLTEECQQLQLRITSNDTETVKKIQEESEKKIQDLVNSLETEKQKAAIELSDTEDYWKQQFKSLQEDMEAEMKQQRMTFENELAEQRAEYDTRVNSVLEEQEGLLLGQKAIMEDKIQSLQETISSIRAQFSATMADKEAEFVQKLKTQETEAEGKLTSLNEQLDRRVAEKEVEFQQKLSIQEAEMEKKLEDLKEFMQKEMESHRTIRSQMEQDRIKIHHLETQLAERCLELEELLQTENEERGEVVARVVEENREELLALQLARDQERQHSLQQISDLQAETNVIKEELAVSVQRTESLQRQLSELETQKNHAVQHLEQEVEKQIRFVKHTEEENCHLQNKILELKSVMSQHKSELVTLRSSVEQQRAERAEWQAQEFRLKEKLRAQPAYKDQVRQLTGQVASLKAEYQILLAENKTIQENATETTKSMAEQLKRYERKCQQQEREHSLLEDRLHAYEEKEATWGADHKKMKELNERVQELEAVHVKTATPAKMIPSETKTCVTDSATQSRYDLRSKVQMDLDGSFTNTLPATPGAAERQMLAIRDLDTASMSGRSGRYSTYSSGRSSTYSTGSTKSVVFVPMGAGKLFAMEDEPESPKYEWGRLNELQRRNTLCPPHMKSSYPVETQTVKGRQFDDQALQQVKVSHKEQKQRASTSSSGSTPASRKRKPEAMDVDDEHAARPGASEAQSRKLARHGPIYQRPGPPTPLTDRHRKLSDPHQLSAGRKKSSTPRRSPRRSPRVRATPRRYANENVMPQDSLHDSVAFDIGFSPVRTASTRSLTRQKAFLSKSKLPQMPKHDDHDDSLSPLDTSSTSKSKITSRSKTPQSAQSKGRRRPLSVRNCLQTQL